MKTSAVLVASGDLRCIYASLRDVPEPLRQQVIASTSGRNSGTILIADRRGKQEIESAARAGHARPAAELHEQFAWRRTWPILIALLIVVCGAAAVFFARV